MKYSLFGVVTTAFLLPVFAAAQQSPAAKIGRTADGHPDLSGVWGIRDRPARRRLEKSGEWIDDREDLRSERTAAVPSPGRGCPSVDTDTLL